MSGLLKSIAETWKNSKLLCSQIPFNRFFVGRMPTTQEYRFPYCSALTSPGWHLERTDKTDRSAQLLTFSIWVDDAKLHVAEIIENLLYDTYANTCWQISDRFKCLDVIDQGEGQPKQPFLPTVKAWNVNKVFLLILERERVDTGCCAEEESEFGSSVGSTISESSVSEYDPGYESGSGQ